MTNRRAPKALGFCLAMIVLASPAAGAGLTAGDVDDNLNFEAFQAYAAGATEGVLNKLPDPDLSDRVTLRVRSADGAPVSWARVVYRDADGPAGSSAMAFTGSDGVVRLFPAYELGGAAERLAVDVYHPTAQQPGTSVELATADLAESRVFDVVLATGTPAPAALDLAIVLDTTGSMGDEFEYLADELEGIVGSVREQQPDVHMRFALVVYRDHGDAYVVRSYPFTDSLEGMQATLAAQDSRGGGDTPEAVEEALEAAMQLDWRGGNTAKLLWLVADAPPHASGYDRTMEAYRDARERGVHIYPVSGSGVGDAAEYLFRVGALLTQGRYAFLTDDSGIGESHVEPAVPCFQVVELSDLLTRIVEGELAGHRVEAAPESVIRTVGNFHKGVCLAPGEEPGGEEPAPAPPELPGTARTSGPPSATGETSAASTPGLGAPILLLALAGVAVAASRVRRPGKPRS